MYGQIKFYSVSRVERSFKNERSRNTHGDAETKELDARRSSPRKKSMIFDISVKCVYDLGERTVARGQIYSSNVP